MSQMKYVIEAIRDMGTYFEVQNYYGEKFQIYKVEDLWFAYMPEDKGKEFPVAIALVSIVINGKEIEGTPFYHIFWKEGKAQTTCGSIEGLSESIGKAFEDHYGPDKDYKSDPED